MPRVAAPEQDGAMGVGVEIQLTPSRIAGRWAAVAALVAAGGWGLAALQLLGGPTLLVDASPGHRTALACAGGLLAIAACGVAFRDLRRRAPAPSGRTLRVDDSGEPAILGPAPEAARPMALRASCTLPGLILLVMAPYLLESPERRLGRPIVMLLGRDAVPVHAWRRLHVWLRWMERGRAGP